MVTVSEHVRPCGLRIVVERPESSLMSSIVREFPSLSISIDLMIENPQDRTITVLAHMYFSSRESSLTEVLSRLRKSSKVLEAKLIARSGTSAAVLVVKELCEFLHLLRRYGVVLLYPYTHRGGSRIFHALAPSKKLALEFISELEKSAKRVKYSVTSVTELLDKYRKYYLSHLFWHYFTTELTETQQRVLLTALRMGYFEWPRRVRVEDLAKCHGVSKATVTEHLRKAEAKLLKFFLSTVREYAKQVW